MHREDGLRMADGHDHGVGSPRVRAPRPASAAPSRLLAPLLAAAALLGVACGGDDAEGAWTPGPVPGAIGFNAGDGADGGGSSSATCRIRLSGAVTRVVSCGGATTYWDGSSGRLWIRASLPGSGATGDAYFDLSLRFADEPAARTYTSQTASIESATARVRTADGLGSWSLGPPSERFTLAFTRVTNPMSSGNVVTYTTHGRVHLVLSALSSAGSAARDLTLDVMF